MIWITFLGYAACIVIAAIRLSEYGDAIACRTRLSQMFVGTLLLATATSMPELLTMINAITLGHVNLTAGDLFGSNMFNMMLLGLLGLVFYKARVLRRVAMRHALTAGLAAMLTALAVFFLLADIDWRIGWVGVDSLMLIAGYAVGLWLLRANSNPAPEPQLRAEDLRGVPGLWEAGLGFALAVSVLLIAAPRLVQTSAEIATLTGLGTGLVGMLMVALVTSLPELVATAAAARAGAYDMAVGNLFGSNVFNMFALGVADFIYVKGRFLGAVNPTFALAGMLAVLLIMLGLLGNLAKVQRRLWIVEIDALLLVLAYFGGLLLLYQRGIGH